MLLLWDSGRRHGMAPTTVSGVKNLSRALGSGLVAPLACVWPGRCVASKGSRSEYVSWWGKQRFRKAQWTNTIHGEAQRQVVHWCVSTWRFRGQMRPSATCCHASETRPGIQLTRPGRVHGGHHLNPSHHCSPHPHPPSMTS